MNVRKVWTVAEEGSDWRSFLDARSFYSRAEAEAYALERLTSTANPNTRHGTRCIVLESVCYFERPAENFRHEYDS